MPVKIRVNGQAHSLEVDEAMPLLWVLRDLLGLTGTKFGCGVAQCGACMVHIDGEAQPSCVTPVALAAGKSVTTIEAIGATPIGAKVQRAWLELDVVQCGYCQSGQVMAACALLAKTPKPDDVAIDEGMRRNVCRCGTYSRIRAAIHKAAQS